MKMVSKIVDTKNLKAMVKALENTKCFEVIKDSETVIVKTISTKKKNIEVFRALKNRNIWIVRLMDNLFV